jgi:hypothetical protein
VTLPPQAQPTQAEAAREAATKKSWRDTIKVHPDADLFPMMSDGELEALGENIKENGLLYPLLVGHDENGNPCLLDGRNRLEAMERAGILVSIDLNKSSWSALLTKPDAAAIDPFSRYILADKVLF